MRSAPNGEKSRSIHDGPAEPAVGTRAAERTAASGIPTLTVESAGSVRRWTLVECDGTIEVHEQLLDEATLALQRDAHALLRGGTQRELQRNALAIGHRLYRHSFPPALRDSMQRIGASLRLYDATADEAPWPLLHDGDDFWATGRRIGLAASTGERDRAPRFLSRRPRRDVLLVGTDPDGTFPFLLDELRALARDMEPVARVRLHVGREASAVALQHHLAHPYDVVHLCGLVAVERDQLSFRCQSELFNAQRIADALSGHPIVVLHGVAPASIAAIRATTFADAANRWLDAGAAAVVFAVTDAADRFTGPLLQRFHERLFNGESAGEALRSACAATRDDPQAGHSPAWLVPRLYGHPDTVMPAHRPVRFGGGPAAVRFRLPFLRARRRWARSAAAVTALALFVPFVREAMDPRPVPVLVLTRRNGFDAGVRAVLQDAADQVRHALATAPMPRGFGLLAPWPMTCRRPNDCLDDRVMRLVIDADPVGASPGTVSLTATAIDADGRVWWRRRVDEMLDDPTLHRRLADQVLRALEIAPAREFSRADVATIGAHQRFRASLDGTVVEPELQRGEFQEAAPSNPWIDAAWRTWRNAYHPMGDPEAPTPADREAIESVLAEYRTAVIAGDVDALAALQPGMADAQREALSAYFEIAPERDVDLVPEGLVMVEGRAVFTGWRRDRLTLGSDRHVDVAALISIALRRVGDEWRIQDQRSARGAPPTRTRVRRARDRSDVIAGSTMPPDESAIFREDFDDGAGEQDGWTGLPHTHAAPVRLEVGASMGGGVRIDARAGGGIVVPIPHGAAAHAEFLELLFRAAEAGRFTLAFSSERTGTVLTRTLDVPEAGWAEERIPLRLFRAERMAPRWDDVDRLTIRFERDGELVLDRVELLRGDTGSPWISPQQLGEIAFPRATGSAAIVMRQDGPWEIQTDAPDVEIAPLLDALRRVEIFIRSDLPFLPRPPYPVPVIVFTNAAESWDFFERYSRLFGLRVGRPLDAGGRTIAGWSALGIAATWRQPQLPRLVVHEAVHAYAAQTLGPIGARNWFTEGLAERFERAVGQRDDDGELQRQIAVRGFPHLAELTTTASIAGHDYLPAAFAVDWLFDDGRLRNQLPHLVRGMQEAHTANLERLAEPYLGMPMDELEARWSAWLHARHGIAAR